ncbi:dual specificity protein phosphatase family protein [Chloroflexota bacterium]
MNSDLSINPAIHPEEMKPFRDSYWVIPGRFLAGAYPGLDNMLTTRKRLTKFLQTGIDRYYNLTGEHELVPYDEILAEEANLLQMPVIHHRFSIVDRGLPSKMLMFELLNSIDAALDNNHKVYVHCWGGIGRTGTTVGCYLVRHGMSGEQALDKLAAMYATAGQSRFHPRSPETREQMDFILNWNES